MCHETYPVLSSIFGNLAIATMGVSAGISLSSVLNRVDQNGPDSGSANERSADRFKPSDFS